MINSEVLLRLPLNFKNKFNIYPPSVKEVVQDPDYGRYIKLLTLTSDDIKDELAKKEQFTNIPTPFEFLLINCYHYQDFANITKKAFKFFTHQEVNFFFDDKLLVLGTLTEVVQKIDTIEQITTITEEDYFDFQNSIRIAIGERTVDKPEPVDPDEDPRIAKIKAKARERDRIKARQNAKSGISLTTSLLAICCMGIGVTPLNIGEMSYASIGAIMSMMQEKEKYDIDIRSLLAGADSKKIKPKYWIRNSDKD